MNRELIHTICPLIQPGTQLQARSWSRKNYFYFSAIQFLAIEISVIVMCFLVSPMK